MPHEMSPGKPTTRRYSEAESERAVRAVRQLRKELGTDRGTAGRVAAQLGIGVESLRSWVRQAEVDAGVRPGVNSEQAERIKALEQEVRDLIENAAARRVARQAASLSLGAGGCSSSPSVVVRAATAEGSAAPLGTRHEAKQ